MYKKIFIFVFFSCAICIFALKKITTAPLNGSYPAEITLSPRVPLSLFIDELYAKKIVKSKYVTKIAFVLSGYDKKIKPNIYTFEQPKDLFGVLHYIGFQSKIPKSLRVTIPEGSTIAETQTIVERTFTKFQAEDRLNQSFLKKDEGYLFPDTYFFTPDVTEDQIVKKMKDTFYEKTKTIFSGLTEKQIKDTIIMASILEKEGRTDEERKVISGILWKRLREGMPLQVDATFLYTLGKGSSELSLVDLQKDNPYNTYTNKGLPIAPINNPGLETINAALYPESSPYYFYLHDKNGVAHYAQNFEEHKKNKAKYLN